MDFRHIDIENNSTEQLTRIRNGILEEITDREAAIAEWREFLAKVEEALAPVDCPVCGEPTDKEDYDNTYCACKSCIFDAVFNAQYYLGRKK